MANESPYYKYEKLEKVLLENGWSPEQVRDIVQSAMVYLQSKTTKASTVTLKKAKDCHDSPKVMT